MSRDWTLQLDDIRLAIGKIRSYTKVLDYAAFAEDVKTQDAVIRNLEIIGEAARLLPEFVKTRADQVEWRKISALRNILLHEYFGINLQIVWDIVINKLGELDEVCLILQQGDRE